MRTLPLAPDDDVTVHIVLNDFGPLGQAYVETDEAKGQYSHPVRVVAFNTAEGWACDVTEDIARAVWSKARSEYRPIGKVAQEFLERALGADATAGD
jgi:hypothetical protein